MKLLSKGKERDGGPKIWMLKSRGEMRHHRNLSCSNSNNWKPNRNNNKLNRHRNKKIRCRRMKEFKTNLHSANQSLPVDKDKSIKSWCKTSHLMQILEMGLTLKIMVTNHLKSTSNLHHPKLIKNLKVIRNLKVNQLIQQETLSRHRWWVLKRKSDYQQTNSIRKEIKDEAFRKITQIQIKFHEYIDFYKNGLAIWICWLKKTNI